MKNTDLLKAMTDIDDEFIEEAARKRTSLIPSGFSLRTATSLAMAAIAIVAVIVVRPQLGMGRKGDRSDDKYVYEYNTQGVEKEYLAPSSVSNKANDSLTAFEEREGEDGKQYFARDGTELYTVIKTREVQDWNLPVFVNQGVYDYRDYSVHVFGNEADKAEFAQWERNGYYYSITFAEPFAVEEALKIIAEIE